MTWSPLSACALCDGASVNRDSKHYSEIITKANGCLKCDMKQKSVTLQVNDSENLITSHPQMRPNITYDVISIIF